MKLATLKDGSRDGQLIIVAKDLKSAVVADHIAPTMQDLLDSWDFMQPQCEDLYVQLNQGRAHYSFEFDPRQCMAPLPRAYQRVAANAYVGYLEQLYQSIDSPIPAGLKKTALFQFLTSDAFLGSHDPIDSGGHDQEYDFYSELAIVTGDIAQGTVKQIAAEQIRLLMLCADIVTPPLAFGEDGVDPRARSVTSTAAFSPVAVTPDELVESWQASKVHLPLRSSINGKLVAQPEADADMNFDFASLLSQLVNRRTVRAGTIVTSGPVFMANSNKGCGNIAGIRAKEKMSGEESMTPYLKAGDSVRADMQDKHGKSVFGSIELVIR